jgi:hypothetical protein
VYGRRAIHTRNQQKQAASGTQQLEIIPPKRRALSNVPEGCILEMYSVYPHKVKCLSLLPGISLSTDLSTLSS